jgi:hypothetical protein
MTIDELIHLELDRAPFGFVVRIDSLCKCYNRFYDNDLKEWRYKEGGPITTIEELHRIGRSELRREPNIGKKTLEHLFYLMKKYYVPLGSSLPPLAEPYWEELADMGVFPR